jgi:carboxy-cis,cis-muconate cyclase
VHLVDPSSGGFGEKVQQVLFVPEDELEAADKTRVALVRDFFSSYYLNARVAYFRLVFYDKQRYGSHAVEISSQGHAFIPVL